MFFPNRNYYYLYLLQKQNDDLILEDKRIMLIKIDTDGHDFEYLCSSEKFIKRQFSLIIIEMAENKNNIHQKLIDLGCQYFYDQHYKEIVGANYPPNLVASIQPLKFPVIV